MFSNSTTTNRMNRELVNVNRLDERGNMQHIFQNEEVMYPLIQTPENHNETQTQETSQILREVEEEELQRQQDINDYIEYCEEIEQLRVDEANSHIDAWNNWGSQPPPYDIDVRRETEDEILLQQMLKEYDDMHQMAIDEMVELLKKQDRAEIEERIENTKECAICMEQIDITNNCVTPCGHKFCFTCILTSYSRNKMCPLCRADLNPDIQTTEQQYMNLPNAASYEENPQNIEYFNEYYDNSGNNGEGETLHVLQINNSSQDIVHGLTELPVHQSQIHIMENDNANDGWNHEDIDAVYNNDDDNDDNGQDWWVVGGPIRERLQDEHRTRTRRETPDL
jgi:L-rhamnose mutarotase